MSTTQTQPGESNANAQAEIASLKNQKTRKSESLYTKALRRILHDKLTMGMLLILVLLVLFSLSAPLIEQTFGVSYTRTNVPSAYLPIGSMPHVLGTDDLGRDQLSRLAYAGQISLSIAFGAALLSLSIGLALGIITGYYGGIIDDITIWAITTLNSIPTLLLLIIVVAIFRPKPEVLVLVLGLLGWTGTARLVRGETFGLREREYIISARALGASDLRIMWSHIAPNRHRLPDVGRGRPQLLRLGGSTAHAELGQHAQQRANLLHPWAASGGCSGDHHHNDRVMPVRHW
jgi:peptide/nickel transport system permease protein